MVLILAGTTSIIYFNYAHGGQTYLLTSGMMSGCVKHTCLDISIFKNDIKYVIAFDLSTSEVVCCFHRNEGSSRRSLHLGPHQTRVVRHLTEV
jgi:hypothetical protein